MPMTPLRGVRSSWVIWARKSVLVWLARTDLRSEEHTSELQSHLNLVCRLLLEKKNNNTRATAISCPASSSLYCTAQSISTTTSRQEPPRSTADHLESRDSCRSLHCDSPLCCPT